MVTASNNKTNHKKYTVKDKKNTVKDTVKYKKNTVKDTVKDKKTTVNDKKNTVKDKKNTVNNIHKKEEPKNKTEISTIDVKKEDDKGGPLDEKGNPYPIENPEGGDPICIPGYKIDYDFDPFNDPINPPFRCISSLKDPSDSVANKVLQMANNPSSGIQNMAMKIPRGMSGGSRRKYRNHTRKIRRRSLSRRRRTRPRPRTRSRRH